MASDVLRFATASLSRSFHNVRPHDRFTRSKRPLGVFRGRFTDVSQRFTTVSRVLRSTKLRTPLVSDVLRFTTALQLFTVVSQRLTVVSQRFTTVSQRFLSVLQGSRSYEVPWTWYLTFCVSWPRHNVRFCGFTTFDGRFTRSKKFPLVSDVLLFVTVSQCFTAV